MSDSPAGDREAAAYKAGIKYTRQAYPRSTAVAGASSGSWKYVTLGRAGWSSGLVAAGADKGLGDGPALGSLGYHGNDSYNRFRDHFTQQVVAW